MNFNEAEVIAALARIFGGTQRGVEIGIGDDAAVVKTSERTAITTDVAVEGTHFKTQWSSAFDIGRKITAANLADIYAMGGSPRYLVAAVTLTGDESMEWIEELAEGIAHEARGCGAYVVGGDLAKGPCKSIAITAIGLIDGAITRSGAQIGDSIYISSLPGWSAAGLTVIDKDLDSDIALHAISEFSAPTVDYSVAVQFSNGKATSMCDISDAFVIQAEQIAAASGVQLHIEKELISEHPEFGTLNELADSQGVDVWQWILAGGEDHVFLATGQELDGFRIGSVLSGSGLTGAEMKKAPDTWRHFQ
ncbi:MAG: thiamine-phosphate kinase [Candidatus Planktophila sp.]|nr:thiamine-phosphate kinase [Candidatus Planktophila sp.]